MKLCVLGSGSEGNCTLLYTDTTAILVDAGFTCRKIERLLEGVGFDPNRLNAILITHEHSDHLRGAAVASRRYTLPLFLTEGTANNCNGALKKSGNLNFVEPEKEFSVGDMQITPFTVPHDCAEPVGYMVSSGGRHALVLTDIGSVTVRAVEKIRMAHLAMVESNHDIEMLRDGPYPPQLKIRVGGAYGHLSNVECAELLSHAGGNGLKTVVFAHLSKVNNSPDIVRSSAKAIFDGTEVTYAVASQHEPTEIFEV